MVIMDTVVRIGVILAVEITRVIKRPANVMIVDVKTGFMAISVINLVANTVLRRGASDTVNDVLIVLRVIIVISAMNHVQRNANGKCAINRPESAPCVMTLGGVQGAKRIVP